LPHFSFSMPTTYQSFVATHRRQGKTFKQIGAMWRKTRPKTTTTKKRTYTKRASTAPKRTYTKKAGPKNVTPYQRRTSKCGSVPPGTQIYYTRGGKSAYFFNKYNKRCYIRKRKGPVTTPFAPITELTEAQPVKSVKWFEPEPNLPEPEPLLSLV